MTEEQQLYCERQNFEGQLFFPNNDEQKRIVESESLKGKLLLINGECIKKIRIKNTSLDANKINEANTCVSSSNGYLQPIQHQLPSSSADIPSVTTVLGGYSLRTIAAKPEIYFEEDPLMVNVFPIKEESAQSSNVANTIVRAESPLRTNAAKQKRYRERKKLQQQVLNQNNNGLRRTIERIQVIIPKEKIANKNTNVDTINEAITDVINSSRVYSQQSVSTTTDIASVKKVRAESPLRTNAAKQKRYRERKKLQQQVLNQNNNGLRRTIERIQVIIPKEKIANKNTNVDTINEAITDVINSSRVYSQQSVSTTTNIASVKKFQEGPRVRSNAEYQRRYRERQKLKQKQLLSCGENSQQLGSTSTNITSVKKVPEGPRVRPSAEYQRRYRERQKLKQKQLLSCRENSQQLDSTSTNIASVKKVQEGPRVRPSAEYQRRYRERQKLKQKQLENSQQLGSISTNIVSVKKVQEGPRVRPSAEYQRRYRERQKLKQKQLLSCRENSEQLGSISTNIASVKKVQEGPRVRPSAEYQRRYRERQKLKQNPLNPINNAENSTIKKITVFLSHEELVEHMKLSNAFLNVDKSNEGDTELNCLEPTISNPEDFMEIDSKEYIITPSTTLLASSETPIPVFPTVEVNAEPYCEEPIIEMKREPNCDESSSASESDLQDPLEEDPTKWPILNEREAYYRRKIQMLQKRLKRRDSKITNLTNQIQVLKNETTLSDETLKNELEKRFSGDVVELFRNELVNSGKSKTHIRYTDKMKEFALSIYRLSPKAYNFLGDKLQLPDVSILRKFVAKTKREMICDSQSEEESILPDKE